LVLGNRVAPRLCADWRLPFSCVRAGEILDSSAGQVLVVLNQSRQEQAVTHTMLFSKSCGRRQQLNARRLEALFRVA